MCPSVKIKTLLRQLAMILVTKMFASDGQRRRALSLRWDGDVESDIANPSYRCRPRIFLNIVNSLNLIFMNFMNS
jgi:predicted metal-dependent hydrolase